VIRHVLVVCVGNLCRSPIAEGLLKQHTPGLCVSSGGLLASTGLPADPQAVQVMATRGIDLSAHRSQPLTATLCAKADLILCMTQRQRRSMGTRYPSATGKTFVLGATAIVDPYRRGPEAFVECLASIESALDAWIPRLQMLCGDLEEAKT
jgi:protein-tyrosine phosphatase